MCLGADPHRFIGGTGSILSWTFDMPCLGTQRCQCGCACAVALWNLVLYV